jgi:cytoskeleton-associated protein 5
MADTNLSVKMLALGLISKIATGMGTAFDKYNKILAAAVASVCADQKATTRSTALATLTAMAEASGGLDSLYSGLATSCESPNPVLRASVLGWLADKFAAEPPASTSDLQPLASPVVHCLEDRNGDVRKAASAVLPYVVANTGADFVMDQTSKLKPASRATIIPLIEKARANAPSAPAPAPSKAAPAKVAPAAGTPAKARVAAPSRPTANSPAAAASRPTAAPVRSLAMKALSTAPSTRQPIAHDDRPSALPKPRMGLQRPASSMSSAPSASSSSAKIVPFQSDVPEPRIMRLKKDSARWILETGPKTDLTEYLAHQMEHHASPELSAQLFSKDHRAEEDFMAALTTLSDFYDANAASIFGISEDDARALQLANVDLALKYAALKLLLNNTQLANRCLDVIAHVSETVARYEERFSDVEAKLFMPALIFKVSHLSDVSIQG